MSFKFSEDSVALLRNFATINDNIFFNVGNKISTITDTMDFMGTGSIAEDFPLEFGIYDLSEFLNVLSLVNEPNLDFSDTFVTINDVSGNSKIKYFYSSPEILTVAKKMPSMPSVDLTFELSDTVLSKLKRAGSTLGLEYMSLTKDENSLLNLSIVDIDNKTSNTFTTQVPCETEMEDFNLVFNLSNIKILEGTYKISISKRLISEFENTERNLKYFLALEKGSKV